MYSVQLYANGVLVGGVDELVELAEDGALKAQLMSKAGFRPGQPSSSATSETKSVKERCKEIVER